MGRDAFDRFAWHPKQVEFQRKRGWERHAADAWTYIARNLDSHYAQFLNDMLMINVGTVDEFGRPWASSLTYDGHRHFMESKGNEFSIKCRLLKGDPIGNNLRNGLTTVEVFFSTVSEIQLLN